MNHLQVVPPLRNAEEFPCGSGFPILTDSTNSGECFSHQDSVLHAAILQVHAGPWSMDSRESRMQEESRHVLSPGDRMILRKTEG
jgi:hypothetical protein